ncbi:MAG: TonB family protein [Bacteroidales bacterium]|nr:TonB family protein [Bacteroidales bacterium]
MKKLFFIFISLPFALLSQTEIEKIFFDDKDEICDSATASYFITYTTIYDNTFECSGKEIRQHSDGHIIEEGFYSNLEKNIKNGICKEYYDNGAIKSIINWKNGKYDGELITYHKNGKQRRKDIYQEGNFISGNCYTETGKDTTHYIYMLMPEYKGGMKKLREDLIKFTNYPNKARIRGITGRVLVGFVVNKEGFVENIKIKYSTHHLFDAEALRVVKLLDRWTPGIVEGENVNVKYTLPISFRLN